MNNALTFFYAYNEYIVPPVGPIKLSNENIDPNP